MKIKTQIIYILFFCILFNICKSNIINLDSLKIENKSFFSCYLNPFSRFENNSISELSWEIGNYDSQTILNNYHLKLNIDIDNSILILNFLKSDISTCIVTFQIDYMITLNNIDLEVKNIHNSYLNCNKFNGCYSVRFINNRFNLFYNDSIILSANISN